MYFLFMDDKGMFEGLKSGLEIHQQLNTGKLFCACPSVLRQDEPDFTVKRKLHAVAGERGGVDVAAEYQASQDKEFVYQSYDTNCLVELDEEPPHQINPEALEITLQMAHLLHAKILPITQIMRKTVIDGSNTSGFQRTVVIARDGFIETSFGRVGIETICLEEDSARIVSSDKQEHVTVYRLDRLGIPLVEIATTPDIKTPAQAKETALKIGEILRACNVRRGLGTIRQDVNLSVNYPKGKRIELKGFQDIKNIETAIEFEVTRQRDLIGKNKSISEVRKVLPDGHSEFLRPMPGSARMYPETDLPLLRISRQMIDDAKKNLPKLKDEIETELEKEGLSKDFVSLLMKRGKIEEFKELMKVLKRADLVGKILLEYPKEISGHEKIPLEKVEQVLTIDVLGEILENVKRRELSENNVEHALENIVRGVALEKALKFDTISVENLEGQILNLIKSKPGLTPNAYMGLVMKEFKGQISGKEAMEIIRKIIK